TMNWPTKQPRAGAPQKGADDNAPRRSGERNHGQARNGLRGEESAKRKQDVRNCVRPVIFKPDTTELAADRRHPGAGWILDAFLEERLQHGADTRTDENDREGAGARSRRALSGEVRR